MGRGYGKKVFGRGAEKPFSSKKVSLRPLKLFFHFSDVVESVQ